MSITPSRFQHRPVAYLRNQLGHGAIGFAAVEVTGWPVLIVVILYALLIELPQIVEYRERWVPIDSAEDTGHVAVGAFLAAAFSWWVLALWVTALGFGVRLRADAGNRPMP